MSKLAPILLADHRTDDVMHFYRAHKKSGPPRPLVHCVNGLEAIHYLGGKGKFGNRKAHPFPALLVMELSLPKCTGFSVLKWLRDHPQRERLPVLILTASTRPEDRQRATELGAWDFMQKPPGPEGYFDLAQQIHHRWLNQLPPPDDQWLIP